MPSRHPFNNQTINMEGLASARRRTEHINRASCHFPLFLSPYPFCCCFYSLVPVTITANIHGYGVCQTCAEPIMNYLIWWSPNPINTDYHFCHHNHHLHGEGYQLAQVGGGVRIWIQVIWCKAHAIIPLPLLTHLLSSIQRTASWTNQTTSIILEDVDWFKESGFVMIN